MAWYLWTYDSMEMLNISKKESFEPMNYKLPGIYKFYSTIINACFEYFREINNEYIVKNRIILVLWFLLMVPPSSLRMCSMKQCIIFITVFTCTIYSNLEVKWEHVIIITVLVFWQIHDIIGWWLDRGVGKPQEGA